MEIVEALDKFESIWWQKYRPTKLEDLILSDDNRDKLLVYKDKGSIPHLLFHGVFGIGKTTLANIIAKELLDCDYEYINASDSNGIDTVRNDIVNFANTASFSGGFKVIILDEFDGFTTQGQKALNGIMEEYSSSTRFILTCNNIHSVLGSIKSRCTRMDLTPPIQEYKSRIVDILKRENVKVSKENKPALVKLIKKSYPDFREVLSIIQFNSKSGEFIFNEDLAVESLTKEIYKKLNNIQDLFELRKFIIQNESNFNSNYSSLLSSLYDYIFNNQKDLIKKRNQMMIVGKFLAENHKVFDMEINFFNCLLELSLDINS